ncbi:hypothetical protein CI1B_45800 [Bradyrhizobium ivorense]|uniref:Uncharacterized protein n=1 Tax=Bradyrhizobium ivorense TaxID=2511166 RepID=A0A508TEM7_9BRAD|nr:hypothetical protein CI1B_45800 [Bradyrhizobium ivorense]
MKKMSYLLVMIFFCFPSVALAAGTIDGGTKQAVNWAAIACSWGSCP